MKFLRDLTGRRPSSMMLEAEGQLTNENPMDDVPSAYLAIDDVIDRWVKRDGLALGREWQGEARFWYTSRGSECFQISVTRPVGKTVTVHAWSVETDDDAELHGKWCVNLPDLEGALATATNLIDLWASRARIVS